MVQNEAKKTLHHWCMLFSIWSAYNNENYMAVMVSCCTMFCKFRSSTSHASVKWYGWCSEWCHHGHCSSAKTMSGFYSNHYIYFYIQCLLGYSLAMTCFSECPQPAQFKCILTNSSKIVPILYSQNHVYDIVQNCVYIWQIFNMMYKLNMFHFCVVNSTNSTRLTKYKNIY